MALLGLMLPMAATAQTMVSGAIESDTHWIAANSPYVVSGEVVIRNNATLTIDPGVDVYMQAVAMVTVQSGSLRALGTEAAPIRVRSDKVRLGQAPAAGDFGPWTFQPGTTNSQLEHVVFEHGRGIAVQGASPVFNHLDLRNNLGAAISVDLAASPSGVGNRAIGNELDGIAVPAGEIQGSVKWGIRGIPYVVHSGTVSVGAAPRVAAVSVSSIEQGQTVTVTVDGSRLTGVASASFDRDGLATTVFPGGNASRFSMQVVADADAQVGQAALRVLVDAGEVLVPNALNVTPPLPGVTTISPTTAIAGSGVTEITVTGRNFNAQSEVLVNSAAIPTTYVSRTELRGSLPNQTSASTMSVHVRNPDPLNPGQHLVSTSSATLTVQMPVPPVVAFEPTPIAMPPDGQPHDILVRLSKADFRDHTLAFSLSDPTKANLVPQTLVIPAGQTTARLSITPLAQGSVTLIAQSPTLAEIRVPLFITPDFQGASTSYARPVGIVVEGELPTTSYQGTVTQQGVVGVSVGAVLTGATPGGWKVGSTQSFTIHGKGIPPGSQLALAPSEGISLGESVIAPDGSSLTTSVTAAANAPIGPRRLVVRDATGSLLAFADAAASVVYLGGGAPQLDSVTPNRVSRGSTVALVVRGRNLQNAKVEVLPGAGIAVDAEPQISTDGTELRASIEVAPDASLGDKVVRITTPSGTSAETANPGNSFQVVTTLGPDYLTSAPIVGVVVGDPPPPDEVAAPLLSSHLGVVVGSSVTDVVPGSAIIGATTTVTVRGQGLQDVTGVSLTPSAGLVLGAPVANAEGTELTFTVEVAADAALGVRKFVLSTATGPLAFADVIDGAFLISAPLAVVDSVTPQVATRGGLTQTITLRGRHLTNASDIRFVPAEGITVNRPFVISEDGTKLDVAILVGETAAPGPRTVIVTTPAGDSSTERTVSNTLIVASQVGPTYPAIATPLVGIVVGDGGTGIAHESALLSSVVGVTIESEPPPADTVDTQAIADAVRVLIGSVATSVAPDGLLQGGSGTVTITGLGLDRVTSVSAIPGNGVLIGQPSVNQEGTELMVPISVAADAALGMRRLRLGTEAGEITWRNAADAVFGIGKIPAMNSTSPIVLNAGTATTLSVRGTDLRNVTGARLLPGDGVRLIDLPVWSEDAFGELLKVTFYIDLGTAPGDRVLQLIVPGGATTESPNATNTIKVVRP